MGTYIDPSGILAGTPASAADVRGMFEALDTALANVATGAAAITPDIDGGSIDGATIGGTTPAAATATEVNIRRAAGLFRALRFMSGALERWTFYADNTAESGSNAGSNFVLSRYSDAGALVDTPLTVNRATGAVTFSGALVHTGANLGFRASTPIAKPTVSGSRGGNAALASLLTALANQGLITDSSSA